MSTLSADSIAQNDLLGRNKFASQIVKSLIKACSDQKESLVVGIAGRWGSGKTTLLTLIEKELSSSYSDFPNQYKVIKLNPWAYSEVSPAEIHRQFLKTIINELKKVDWRTKANSVNQKVKRVLTHPFKWLKAMEDVHPAGKILSGLLNAYLQNGDAGLIEEAKRKADQLILSNNVHLYIMVDDLDRLTPEEIAAVFRTIKLNLNLANTRFLVAYDKKVVIAALSKNFGANAESYLEKIIQVDFTVPEILEDQMAGVFFTRLTGFLNSLNQQVEEKEMQSLWKYHGLKDHFRTLRDINRYFNSLLFSLPNINTEVNNVDFLALEAIKVFDYHAYEAIYATYIRKRREAVWGSTVNKTEARASSFPATQALEDFLFTHQRYDLLAQSSSNLKRLRDPEFFIRYFALYIPQSDVTEESIVQFLSPHSNKEQLLNDLLQHGKMSSFLRRLADPKLNKVYKVDSPYIFGSFISFWNKNDYHYTEELEWDIWNAYFNLAHNFSDPFQGAKEAVEALLIHQSSGESAKMIFNHYLNIFLETRRRDQQIYNDVEKQVHLMREELLKRLKEYLKNSHSDYLRMGHRYQRVFPTKVYTHSFSQLCPEEYKKEIGRYLEDRSFAVGLLKAHFISISVVNKKPFGIDLSKKEVLLPGTHWKTFTDTLRDAPEGSWNDEEVESVRYFLNGIDEQQNISEQ